MNRTLIRVLICMLMGIVLAGCSQGPAADTPAPAEEEDQVAAEHLRRGIDYFEQGQLQLAIEEYTQAIEVDSELAEAYQLRGMVYIALGELDKGIADLDRALPELDQAVEQDPRHAEAYFNRGIAHCFILDYEKAIADFDRAIELNPSYVEAYAFVGTRTTTTVNSTRRFLAMAKLWPLILKRSSTLSCSLIGVRHMPGMATRLSPLLILRKHLSWVYHQL